MDFTSTAYWFCMRQNVLDQTVVYLEPGRPQQFPLVGLVIYIFLCNLTLAGSSLCISVYNPGTTKKYLLVVPGITKD